MSHPRVRGHRIAGARRLPDFRRHYESIPAIIGVVVAAAGTAVTVYGQQQAASTARAAGKYNQRLAENQALQAQYAGEAAAKTQRERGMRVVAMQRSLTAGAGVTPEGSPLLVMMDTVAQSALEEEKARYTGQLQADSARSQATYARWQGGATSRGYQIGAGATLLQGFGDVTGRVAKIKWGSGGMNPNDVQAY